MAPRKRDLKLVVTESPNDGKFRGAIVSGNGWIIAVGLKAFASRSAARHHLSKQFGPGSKRKQVYKDSAGEWRFRVYLDDLQLFKSSEGHKNRSYAHDRADLVLSLAIV